MEGSSSFKAGVSTSILGSSISTEGVSSATVGISSLTTGTSTAGCSTLEVDGEGASTSSCPSKIISSKGISVLALVLGVVVALAISLSGSSPVGVSVLLAIPMLSIGISWLISIDSSISYVFISKKAFKKPSLSASIRYSLLGFKTNS